MTNRTRVVHLDYLRSFIILLVVTFHVSISFMAKAPYWWYVKSSDVSILFSIFVILTDSFMMPLLFLISGFVLSIQLRKFGRKRLLTNRVKRLGIPWIICTLLFSPYLSLYMARAMGKEVSFISMLTLYFWTDFYSQGPYWFLGILLFFTAFVILVKNTISKIGTFPMIPNNIILLLLFAISLLGYSFGAYFFGIDNWLNPLYIVSFQPSRIIAYVCYFLAGFILSERGWDFKIGTVKWVALALPMAFGFVIVKGRFEGVTTLTSYMIQGFFYSGMALSVTLSLVGIFGIFFKKSSPVLSNISKHSFIVYLLHLPILISVGRWIIGISKSMYVCWFILLATVLVLSVIGSQIIGFAQKLLHRFKQTRSLKPAKIFDNKEIHSLTKQD